MVKKIVLYGAGGYARELANMIAALNRIKPRYELLGFLVDEDYYEDDTIINGYPVLGSGKWLRDHPDVCCTCAIADVDGRMRIQEELMAAGVEMETLLAPGAYISPSAVLGRGCVVFTHSLISADCVIEDGVFINACITVGHDARIGRYTSIMPGVGISGGVVLGEKVNIGGHAFIIPDRKVGDGATVAAGSIVFTNVKAGTLVLGNPAKRMPELEG